MTPGRDLQVRDHLDDAERDEVCRLIARAEAVDGVAALNEQALLALTSRDEPQVRHLLGLEDGGLVGYVHLDLSAGSAGAAAESVVDPEHRRQGWGGALVMRAVEEAAPHPVLLWSHGDHPGAARLAGQLGFERVRDLWRMSRDLREPLPPVELPPGVTLRTFRTGEDEEAWLAANARAFAHHPEQGGLDATDLALRTGSDWFDPAGFFLAERDGRLVGFHWTKVHAGDPPVGEVYVVGVDPDAQGGGLGRTLTLAGLHHLRDRGLAEVLLYVEADNAPALRVYEHLGFRHAATDTRYRHPGLPR